jgi:hypothetical protein
MNYRPSPGEAPITALWLRPTAALGRIERVFEKLFFYLSKPPIGAAAFASDKVELCKLAGIVFKLSDAILPQVGTKSCEFYTPPLSQPARARFSPLFSPIK